MALRLMPWALACCARVAAAAAGTVTLDGDTPWVVAGSSGVPPSGVDELDDVEPLAFQLALRDVKLDWYRVLGHPPAVQTYPLRLSADSAVVANGAAGAPPPPPPPPYAGPAVYFGTVANCPWLLTDFDLSACELHRGAEAHCVVVTSNGSVVATGNRTRGAIFALYEFSERVLGVDPWWRFTSNTPRYAGSVTLPAGFRSVVGPPAFEYRGAFTNDEDLLGYFRQDPAGQSVFGLETWNQIFETLLRAKCNMIIPGTTPNPDEPHIALANRRGLVVSQSHFEVVDFGALMWLDGEVAPRELFNWTTHADAMAHTWRAAIDANKDKDMIWTVGLRGLWDYSGCGSSMTQPECGAMLSEAISNQTEWIRSAAGPDAKLIAYLWDELLGLWKSGSLVLPKGVNVIFTDEGKGKIGGLDDIHLANGLYYHTMMLDGSSNQITEMISPSLVFSQLYHLVANASSLFYIVDNVSDLVPAPLSTSAVFKFAWDPTPFITNGNATDWNASQHEFLVNWTTVEFGAQVAKEAATLYDRYFAIPHLQRGNADEWIGETLGKLGGSGAGDISGKGAVSNTTAAAAQKALAAAQPSLAPCASLQSDVTAFASKVPANRLQFFRQHLAWQTACQHFGVVAITELAQSLLAASRADAVSHANASLTALDSLFAAQRAGEGDGQWSGAYFGDRLDYTNMQSRRRSVLSYYHALTQQPKVFNSGKGYYSMYQYQKPAVPNYPLFFESQEYNLRDFVLYQIDGENGPDGGQFHGGSARLTMLSTRCRAQGGTLLPPGPGTSKLAPGSGGMMPLENCTSTGITARYTTDGSDPRASPTAKVYSGPITLTKTTTVQAVCVVEGAVRNIVHNATFESVLQPA